MSHSGERLKEINPALANMVERIEAFNAESAQLQELAGVDPLRCLQLARSPAYLKVPTVYKDTPASLHVYGFARRLYLTSADRHDIGSHLDAIRDRHPDIVDVAIAAAKFACSRAPRLCRAHAVGLSGALDVLFTNTNHVSTGLHMLSRELRMKWGDDLPPHLQAFADPNRQAIQKLHATQAEHVLRMVEAEVATSPESIF